MTDAPDILWILCDQLRSDALGCYGNPFTEMRTPTIDSLATSGVRFDRFHVNAPVCVPSRFSMKTGLDPVATGVYHNEGMIVGPVDPMPEPFTRALERQGYETVNFGKAHVPAGLAPFQVSDPTGSDQRDLQHAVDALDPSRTQAVRSANHGLLGAVWPPGRDFPPERVTDGALAWRAGRRSAAPFLCRVSYLQPHTPVVVPRPWSDTYVGVAFPDAVSQAPGLSRFERHYGELSGGAKMSGGDLVAVRMRYYGLVAWIDHQVGRLLDGFRCRDRDLVVVLTSDHGVHLGEQGAFGKQTFAPQVQRVPLLVSWPGTLPDSQVRDDLCEGIDLAATLCGLADVGGPPASRGRDLLAGPRAVSSFATIGYGAPGSTAMPMLAFGRYADGRSWPRRACIRRGTWRLDRNVCIEGRPIPPGAPDADVFLTDGATDPTETHNLAGDPLHHARCAALSRELDAHLAQAAEVDLGSFYDDWAARAATRPLRLGT